MRFGWNILSFKSLPYELTRPAMRGLQCLLQDDAIATNIASYQHLSAVLKIPAKGIGIETSSRRQRHTHHIYFHAHKNNRRRGPRPTRRTWRRPAFHSPTAPTQILSSPKNSTNSRHSAGNVRQIHVRVKMASNADKPINMATCVDSLAQCKSASIGDSTNASPKPRLLPFPLRTSMVPLDTGLRHIEYSKRQSDV